MSASAVPQAVVADAASATHALLRLAGETETAMLERLAASAIGVAEAFTGQALVLRAHEDVVAVADRWTPLAAVPVMAILAVDALAADGTAAALPVEAYRIDIDAGGRGWVRVAPGAGTRVRVRYQAGLASSWDSLPPAVAHGVTTLAAHLFDDRTGAAQPPAAVAALLRPWRRMSLGLAPGAGR